MRSCTAQLVNSPNTAGPRVRNESPAGNDNRNHQRARAHRLGAGMINERLGRHILLVENHPDTAEGLKEYLTLNGHRVISVRDMAGALVAARREKFDVLLSDISLPDGDGWKLMRRLRASDRVSAGIAMSGFGRRKDKQRSLDAGYTVHLVKPFSPDKLEELLRGELRSAPLLQLMPP
jgi:CheY-like chemotaxis protein